MIKCDIEGHGCLESRLIDNKKYYYCYLCNRYFSLDRITYAKIDVTLELKEKGLA